MEIHICTRPVPALPLPERRDTQSKQINDIKGSSFQRSNSLSPLFFSTCLHLLFTLGDLHCYWAIKQMFISWVSVKWKPLLVELLLIFSFLESPQLLHESGLDIVVGLAVISVYRGLLLVGDWTGKWKPNQGSLTVVLHITSSIEKCRMSCS